MNNRGLTLIELLIVIVVAGIITTFSVMFFGDTIANSQVEADSYNLMILNEQTEKYATTLTGTNDIFDGISDNEVRIDKLVKSGFIDRQVRAQQDGAYFDWDVTSQSWELIGGELSDTYHEISVTNYDFGSDSLEDAQSDGTVSINMDKWDTDEGYLENTTGETRIFIPINKVTYTITVNAALNEGSNGGYGIFFDTTLRGGDVSKDDGYVFQFDRGYAEGAMIVRPRVNGSERGPVWTLRANNTDAFPSESEDPDWWTETHTVKIVVSNVDEDTRSASFYIDGVLLGSYEYDNEIAGEQIYTGFRGWGGSPTKFYTINVN